MTEFDRINAQLNRANIKAESLRDVMRTYDIDLWIPIRDVMALQLDLTHQLCAASRVAPTKEHCS